MPNCIWPERTNPWAIGSNQETARLCGVPVRRTKIIVYSLAGFFAGHHLEAETAVAEEVVAVSQRGKLASVRGEDLDVYGAKVVGGNAAVAVLVMRGGQVLDRRELFWEGRQGLSEAAVLSELLPQIYDRTSFIPKEIHLPVPIEGDEALAEWLSERKGERGYLRLPARVSKAQRVALAQRNAEQAQVEAQQAKALAASSVPAAELARREAELAVEQANTLRRQLENLQLRQTESGVVVTLGDVLFETGETDLRSEAMDSLVEVVDLLQSEPDKLIRIEGHTDSHGGDELNQKLSQERAESVMQYMINAMRIPTYRLIATGYGETRPVASNETEAGRARNRRIDIVIKPNLDAS